MSRRMSRSRIEEYEIREAARRAQTNFESRDERFSGYLVPKHALDEISGLHIRSQYVLDRLLEKEKMKTGEKTMKPLRLVEVFAVDPHEDIPLDKSLLYKSDGVFMTDLCDSELAHGFRVEDLLAAYNKYRVTVLDKKTTRESGTAVNLEAAYLREIKIAVITHATFR